MPPPVGLGASDPIGCVEAGRHAGDQGRHANPVDFAAVLDWPHAAEEISREHRARNSQPFRGGLRRLSRVGRVLSETRATKWPQ